MARILDVKCKLCRREGRKLFLKGERCLGLKCPIDRKGAIPPGMHGQKRKAKLSDYGKQLREKQKAKRIYGISERQMRKYFDKAKQQTAKKNENKIGTGENLLRFLESRLDNALFRSGLVPCRSAARQIITHGHVTVDGKKNNIPSYQVKINQILSIGSKAMAIPIVKANLQKNQQPPKWLIKKVIDFPVLILTN